MLTTPVTVLCALCQSLPPLWELHDFQHHELAKLKASAMGGCALCRLIWNTVEHRFNRKNIEAHAGQNVHLSIEMKYGSALITIHHESPSIEAFLELYHDSDSTTSTQTPHLQHVIGKAQAESHRSDATFDFIRQTLANCSKVHDHRCCAPNENVVLPTQVLDVGIDGDPCMKLIHNADDSRRGLYLTLSYCWGPGEVQKSTRLVKSNFHQYQKGISLASLPRTLQDAVLVTRRLGYKYLWIDSLCIVQDDEALRQQQLCQMSNIYMDAFATIQATVPGSAADGFLGLRSQSATASILLPFERDATTGQMSHVMVRQNSGISPTSAAVSSRAWIFQETVLSTRIIRFGASTVDIGCRSEVKYEYGSSPVLDLGPSDYFRLRPDLNLSTSLLAYLSPSTVSKKNLSPRTYQRESLETWYRTISFYYSKRLCAYSDDRLAALAAYAEEAHKVIGGEYHAGLWSVDLVRGLHWKPAGQFLVECAKKYRAPSWSWAAYDGQVQYHGRYDDLDGLGGSEVENIKNIPGNVLSDSHVDWMPTVISAWTSTTDAAAAAANISPSPYGAARSGEIVLETRVGEFLAAKNNMLHLMAAMRPKTRDNSMIMLEGVESGQEEKKTRSTAQKEAVCFGWPDTAAPFPYDRVLCAAFLAPDFGLILTEVETGPSSVNGAEKKFRRIGQFTFSVRLNPSARVWKDGCVRKQITLI